METKKEVCDCCGRTNVQIIHGSNEEVLFFGGPFDTTSAKEAGFGDELPMVLFAPMKLGIEHSGAVACGKGRYELRKVLTTSYYYVFMGVE